MNDGIHVQVNNSARLYILHFITGHSVFLRILGKHQDSRARKLFPKGPVIECYVI